MTNLEIILICCLVVSIFTIFGLLVKIVNVTDENSLIRSLNEMLNNNIKNRETKIEKLEWQLKQIGKIMEE